MMEHDAQHKFDSTADEPDDRVCDDRACANCATNLRGEPVVADSRTGLHLVTCPTCGEREALETYPFAPPIGAFVRPWASVLWLIILLGLIAASVSILGVTSVDSAEEMWRDVRRHAELAITEAMVASGVDRADTQIDVPSRAEWAVHAGADVIFDRMGPWPSWFPWWKLVSWFPIWLLFVLTGAVWSILLWGQPARRRLAVMTAITIMSGLLFLPGLPALHPGASTYFYLASQVIEAPMVWRLFPLLTMLFGSGLLVGVLIGRPIARLYVCIMLPHSLRHGLRPLWTQDGQTFPPHLHPRNS